MAKVRWCIQCTILAGVLAGCGARDDTYASTESRLYLADGIDSRREFEDAIVGHELSGEGVDVTVAPGGQLIGRHLGRPFVGSWEYRRDQFCVSMTDPSVRRAADRRCFHAAVKGREVILVPVLDE